MVAATFVIVVAVVAAAAAPAVTLKKALTAVLVLSFPHLPLFLNQCNYDVMISGT